MKSKLKDTILLLESIEILLNQEKRTLSFIFHTYDLYLALNRSRAFTKS